MTSHEQNIAISGSSLRRANPKHRKHYTRNIVLLQQGMATSIIKKIEKDFECPKSVILKNT